MALFPCWQEGRTNQLLATLIEQTDIDDGHFLLQISVTIGYGDEAENAMRPKCISGNISDKEYAEIQRLQANMKFARLDFERMPDGVHLMFRHAIAAHVSEVESGAILYSWQFAVATLHLDVFNNWDEIHASIPFVET